MKYADYKKPFEINPIGAVRQSFCILVILIILTIACWIGWYTGFVKSLWIAGIINTLCCIVVFKVHMRNKKKLEQAIIDAI